jgi:phosphatidate phosphatase APP1
MTRRRNLLLRAARGVGAAIGTVTGRGGDATYVVGYRGYGTPGEVFVSGRVLRGQPIGPAAEQDPWWRNLANTYRRMESDEIPGARVCIRIGGTAREAVSGDEGYFRSWVAPAEPLSHERLWHPVELELVGEQEPLSTTTTHVLIPAPTARYGIISDLDDTVIRTDATNMLRMLRGVLFTNARTRLPFEGVAGFYQALHQGTGAAANPVFYVSSSPWNLYDVIAEFLEHRRIPMGPLLLRDWGIRPSSLPIGHRSHKLDAIRQILDTYPTLPFLLLGDSGQQDPEIYTEIVAQYPQRILGIYIRDVTGHAERRTAIEELAQQVHEAGSTLVLVEDTVAAARHAASMGWIRPESVEGVRIERSRDHGPGRPPPEHEPKVLE